MSLLFCIISYFTLIFSSVPTTHTAADIMNSQRQDKTTMAMPAGRQVKACVIAPLLPLGRQTAVALAARTSSTGYWWQLDGGHCDSGILGGTDSHPSDGNLSYCLWQGVGCHLPPASPFCKGCQHDDNLSTFRLLVCSCICSCRGCTQTCVADMSSSTYTYVCRGQRCVCASFIHFTHFFHLLSTSRRDWIRLRTSEGANEMQAYFFT